MYLLQVMLAIPIGLQVFQVAEASIGDSLEIGNLISGYDNTVITDFLSVHGASITPLVGQIRYILLLYILVSVFINSGLIYSVVRGQNRWKSFWRGASTFFFSFLKISLLCILIIGIWTLIIGIPLLILFQNALEVLSSEAVLFQSIFCRVPDLEFRVNFYS